LTSLANGKPVPEDASRVLSREVQQASCHRALISARTGFRWNWKGDRTLRSLVHRTAWSIADLLTSDRLDRLHVCDAPGCSWLFLDTTRNHSRRWCDPRTCGNRVRVRRHYRRYRGASARPVT
jgi:predicted RNA-binding Zn ribbon-like protein